MPAWLRVAPWLSHSDGRTQCGEAIGAIAQPESLPLLEQFADDARPEVSETCALAARRLRWTMVRRAGLAHVMPRCHVLSCVREQDGKSKDDGSADNPYQSVDPAPPEDKSGEAPTAEEVAAVQARLLDTELPLFERYRAMFTLRNMQTAEAVVALCAGLTDPTSALFRHEVAYVLGQLQHAAATDALAKVRCASAFAPLVCWLV